jgi:NADH-ubiquinone oxidoreductase chain 4
MRVLVLFSCDGIYIPEDLFMGILIGPILVKIPMYFLHGWLPKAHVEAPVRGSMILAGVMLKMGLFGLCRIMRLFGILSPWLIRILISIFIVGGLVCAVNCLCGYDMKAIIAYSSIAHMGLSAAGVLRGLPLGWSGGLCMGLAHGVCSPCLFIMGGFICKACGSRRILLCGGALVGVPILRGLWFAYCCLNLGVPPSLGFFSEVFIYCGVISLMTYCGGLLLGATRVAGGRYRILLYAKISHGQKRRLLHSTSGFRVRCICSRFLGIPFLTLGRLYLDLLLN